MEDLAKLLKRVFWIQVLRNGMQVGATVDEDGIDEMISAEVPRIRATNTFVRWSWMQNPLAILVL